MSCDAIWRCVADLPEEWYGGDREGLERLVETLFRRRRLIRRLISIFRESTRAPFPNWRENKQVAASFVSESQELAQ